MLIKVWRNSTTMTLIYEPRLHLECAICSCFFFQILQETRSYSTCMSCLARNEQRQSVDQSSRMKAFYCVPVLQCQEMPVLFVTTFRARLPSYQITAFRLDQAKKHAKCLTVLQLPELELKPQFWVCSRHFLRGNTCLNQDKATFLS